MDLRSENFHSDNGDKRQGPAGEHPGAEDMTEPAVVEQGESPDWADLVERIRSGDSSGMEQLYRVFSGGVRYLLCRRMGPAELDDKIHDIFLIVVQAIQRGDLREPERLMGFVRTVVRRQIAAYIERAVQMRRERVDLDSTVYLSDTARDPEESFAFNQKVEVMRAALKAMSKRDREILTRFYLLEQSQETVCAEMGLSETQFRLLKSRAKTKFGEIGRKKLAQKSFSFLVRGVGA